MQQTIEPLKRGDESAKVRVFCQDESRFGLFTIKRRRLARRGVKPRGALHNKYQYFYLFGAVEPVSGDSFFLELPYTNSEAFQLFLDQLALTFADSVNVLVLDNGRHHKAKALLIPDNVVLLFLPPYAPELNPIERLWQAFKDQLAWQIHHTVDELQDTVDKIINAFEKKQIKSITAYPFFVQAVYALST